MSVFGKDISSIVRKFDKNTPESEIISLLNSVKVNPGQEKYLVTLLKEQHPFYEGRPISSTSRIKGYIIASFEETGMPENALVYVLEELENGNHAYLVAASAKAIRGLTSKNMEIFPFLHKAIGNMKGQDDIVSFDSLHPQRPFQSSTTALAEIFRTFGWFGSIASGELDKLRNYHTDPFLDFSKAIKKEIQLAISAIEQNSGIVPADCCDTRFAGTILQKKNFRRTASPDILRTIIAEDQDGNSFPLAAFCKGKVSILTFFYTRCDNPNKCSLTITRLNHLQQALINQQAEDKVNIIAITYDPGFDLPYRLKAYGAARGVSFSANCKFLRITSRFLDLKKHLDLGVSYSGSLVSKHATELFILNKGGKVVSSFSRLQWEVGAIIEKTKSVLQGSKKRTLAGRIASATLLHITNVFNAIIPFLIVFFPKCPFCWATYMSAFGIGGLHSIPYSPWLKPLFIVLMVINIFFLYKRAKSRHMFFPLYLGAAGALFILLRFEYDYPLLSLIGLGFIFLSSLFNSFTFYRSKLKRVSYPSH